MFYTVHVTQCSQIARVDVQEVKRNILRGKPYVICITVTCNEVSARDECVYLYISQECRAFGDNNGGRDMNELSHRTYRQPCVTGHYYDG